MKRAVHSLTNIILLATLGVIMSRAARATCTDVEPLFVATPKAVTLLESARIACFELDVARGRSLVITLVDNDPEDANALFFRWGEPPTQALFDQQAYVRSQASQRLFVPATRNEKAYIAVVAAIIHDGANTVTLEVEEVATSVVARMSPSFRGRGGDRILRAVIFGSNLSDETRFALKPQSCVEDCVADPPCEEQCFRATQFEVISPERVEATFDLTGAAVGNYDLEAIVGDRVVDRLDDAFRVTDTDIGGSLKVTLGGSSVYRNNFPARLTLTVSNNGDRPVPAPIVRVVGPSQAETTFVLAKKGEPYRNEVYVVGFPANGIDGMLPQGAEVKIPIWYQSNFQKEGCPAGLPDACWREADECDRRFRVSVLSPISGQLNPWNQLPAPAGMEDSWEEPQTRKSLVEALGPTWRTFGLAIGKVAYRLSRRRQHTFSLVELFRFAVREALGRPSAAMTGRIVEAESGTPVKGKIVVALQEGVVRSSAPIDRNGDFALDWLQNGTTYEIAVIGYDPKTDESERFETDIAGGSIEVPEGPSTDVLGLYIQTAKTPADSTLSPGCANCNEDGLPEEPISPPCEATAKLFAPYDSWPLTVLSSSDPNDKDGSGEQGESDLVVDPNEPILYTIYFENVDPTPAQEQGAFQGAAARTVLVEDFLDPNLDWSSVILKDVFIAIEPEPIDLRWNTEGGQGGTGPIYGDSSILLNSPSLGDSIPASSICGEVLRPGPVSGGPPGPCGDSCLGCWLGTVRFEAGDDRTTDLALSIGAQLDPEQGKLTWELTAHAAWRELDEDAGFLPYGCGTEVDKEENDSGMAICCGYVTFSVMPKPGLEDGTEVPNEAAITFDATRFVDAVPEVTDVVTLEVTRQPPAVPVDTTPPDLLPSETRLSWESVYAESYDFYLWPASLGNTRPEEGLTAVAEGLTEPLYPSSGSLAVDGTGEHRWTVVAHNSHGSTEPEEPWMLYGRRFRRGDVDGNGALEITDPLSNLAFQFLGTFEPDCLDALDTDDSGLIDITDALRNLEFQFIGGVEIPAPGPSRCGSDPTPDSDHAGGDLGCSVYDGDCD